MDCKKDSKRLKIKAHQMLPTAKPSISLSANKIIMALMNKRKRPKVTMVTGRVKITRTGFTRRFNKLSTMATITAVIKVSTDTFGNTLAKIITARALKSILNSSFMRMDLDG